jgi:hypothetical protein
MVVFMTCRNGKGPMQQRLKAAVALFYKRRGKLPDLIVVNARELSAAQEAAQTLELAVEVRASGGCLVPEVWSGEREKPA